MDRSTRSLLFLSAAVGIVLAACSESRADTRSGPPAWEAATVATAAADSAGTPFTLKRWSPYAVGIGIGVLSWLAFLLSDKSLGCSGAFTRTAGMLERAARGAKVVGKPYYQLFPPTIEWEWMLVAGVLLGSLASSLLSSTFQWTWVPPAWAAAVGTSPGVRWLVALVGGVCLGLGARWAGGCTSGHGISGTLQLAASSWLAAAGFFAGGIITVMLLFRVFFA
jgi:uncharacterized protein